MSNLLKKIWPTLNQKQKQSTNIVMITFWSQFSTYALNTILILFLTRPIIARGLGYDQAKAYAFIGISQATGYLMPILGGHMADSILGLRRSILFGSIFLALAWLLIMLSGYTIPLYGDRLFLCAYALLPASASLLMGTASAMVSRIYLNDAIHAKSAMTFYYMAINVGALLATIVAPTLLDSRYGPLSVLALVFVGKSIAALNFACRYSLYDNVAVGKDRLPMTLKTTLQLAGYLVTLYLFTLFAYSHIAIALIIVSLGCSVGIIWFIIKTCRLSGESRYKQSIAALLILEAIVFFVIYNQMNSTLVLFAKNNSNLNLFGLLISPAQYQMLNPLLIIIIGTQLPRFYQRFPQFSIPWQFACGTALAGLSLIFLAFVSRYDSQAGIINGNYIAITYLMITLAELWVSAIGLSMIGLYCDEKALGFAMGTWYLASSLSNTLSGRIAHWVAIPKNITSPVQSLAIYQHYYQNLGIVTCVFGVVMLFIAYQLQEKFRKRGMVLV
jgi:POT family proton-dependent oligopeptide transporter